MNVELDIVTRPPLRYYGGKFRLAPWIIEQMPEHHTYVEVFGGGASVLLRKPRSKTEFYNDLDKQVFNFFRILRDKPKRDRLLFALEATPFSREEFDLSFEPAVDDIEAARRFVARLQFGHGTASINANDTNGFRSGDHRAGKSYAKEWAGIPDACRAAAFRMRGVTLENQDFRKLIPRLDGLETFFYVDPPYPHSTRNANGKTYNQGFIYLTHTIEKGILYA